MTEKELRKLSKQDVLVLLAEQTARANQLEESLRKAEAELNNRNIDIMECGSIAEASLKLNKIFSDADAAVAQYIANIKRVSENQSQLCKRMEEESKRKGEEIIRNAEKKAAEEMAKADAHWEEIYSRIRNLDKEYSWLSVLIKANGGDKR